MTRIIGTGSEITISIVNNLHALFVSRRALFSCGGGGPRFREKSLRRRNVSCDPKDFKSKI